MFIENWRGRPLVSHEVIVNLIASTTTSKGLRVRAALDTRKYPTGIHVNDADMASLNLVPDNFHGDLNYPLVPFGSSQSKKWADRLRKKL